ncbi:MAG TPA: nucleotidyltransferase family protein [Leptolyngbyaceae cyanobacterium M33_DOE_097]|uniref:Nucleotidyltransferase family protein n=1 Tax=Oscillatoriales cyanobacterium SpSt-418 TaxID=2282169 RepID=A0A7C3KC54_9CYAN|nr:nucleotidyltransferase family protein [Leptolyngbyaceae cyanobacterium M33_DOE_097]
MSRIGILILAAGASTRLGQPKQLLNYRGKPLIRDMAEVAIKSGCQPVGVVVGAYSEIITSHLDDLGIHIIYNEQWITGMASSIRCGLERMVTITPELDAIVLMVCDQPFVSADLIRQLIRQHHAKNCAIVASEYADILGVPALFHQTLFPELASLQGDVGAKSIICQHRFQADSISFAEGAIDLDCPQDLKRLPSLIQVPVRT